MVANAVDAKVGDDVLGNSQKAVNTNSRQGKQKSGKHETDPSNKVSSNRKNFTEHEGSVDEDKTDIT